MTRIGAKAHTHATDTLYQLIEPFLAKIHFKYADRIINQNLQNENNQQKRPLGKHNVRNPEKEYAAQQSLLIIYRTFQVYRCGKLCAQKYSPRI